MKKKDHPFFYFLIPPQPRSSVHLIHCHYRVETKEKCVYMLGTPTSIPFRWRVPSSSNPPPSYVSNQWCVLPFFMMHMAPFFSFFYVSIHSSRRGKGRSAIIQASTNILSGLACHCHWRPGLEAFLTIQPPLPWPWTKLLFFNASNTCILWKNILFPQGGKQHM